jgi:hypothetical protein
VARDGLSSLLCLSARLVLTLTNFINAFHPGMAGPHRAEALHTVLRTAASLQMPRSSPDPAPARPKSNLQTEQEKNDSACNFERAQVNADGIENDLSRHNCDDKNYRSIDRSTQRGIGIDVSPHFLHKDTSDAGAVDYVLTVRRLGRTLPASICASERADIAVARPERVLGSRRAALNST